MEEILELIRKYETDEISCMEFYDKLQSYPERLRETALTLLCILGGYGYEI